MNDWDRHLWAKQQRGSVPASSTKTTDTAQALIEQMARYKPQAERATTDLREESLRVALSENERLKKENHDLQQQLRITTAERNGIYARLKAVVEELRMGVCNGPGYEDATVFIVEDAFRTFIAKGIPVTTEKP